MDRKSRFYLYRPDTSQNPCAPSKAYKDARCAGFDGIEVAAEGVAADGASCDLSGVEGTVSIALAVRCRPVTVADAVDEMRRRLKQARALGARWLSPSLPPVHARPSVDGVVRYQDALNLAYGLLRELRFEADGFGVSIALEAASDGFLLSPVELRELLDAVNTASVGACLDVARIGKIGNPADWIATLGRRVRMVRVDGGSSGGGSDDVALDQRAASAALEQIDQDVAVISAGAADPRQAWRNLQTAGFVSGGE